MHRKRIAGILLMLMLVFCSACSGTADPTNEASAPLSSSPDLTLPPEPTFPADAPLVQEVCAYLNGRVPHDVTTEEDGTLTMYFDLITGDDLLYLQYITIHVNEDSPYTLVVPEDTQIESGPTQAYLLQYTGSQDVGTIVTDSGTEGQILMEFLPAQGDQTGQVRFRFASGLIHKDLGIRVDESIVYHVIPNICTFLEDLDIDFAVSQWDDYTMTMFTMSPREEALVREYIDLLTGSIYGLGITGHTEEKKESWTAYEYDLKYTGVEDSFLSYDISIGYRIPDDRSDGMCFIACSYGLLMQDTGHRSTAARTAPVPDICSFLTGCSPSTDTFLDSGIRKLEFSMDPGDEALVKQYVDHLVSSGSAYTLSKSEHQPGSSQDLTHYYLTYTGDGVISDMRLGGKEICNVYLGLRSSHDLSDLYLLVYYSEGLIPTDDGARADTSKAMTPITDISAFLNNRAPKTQQTLAQGSTRMQFTMAAGEHVLAEQYINSILGSDHLKIQEKITEDCDYSTLTHYFIDYTGSHCMKNLEISFGNGTSKICNLYICIEKPKGNSDGQLTLIYPKQFERKDSGARADFSKVVKPTVTKPSGSGGSGDSGTRDVLERTDCPACFRGRCRKCGGSGYYYKYLPGERKEVRQNCTKCVGGNCSNCNGSGWI